MISYLCYTISNPFIHRNLSDFVYPICTHFIFTSRNIILHNSQKCTVYAIIFHRNGQVRGFSFSKQGFNSPYRRHTFFFTKKKKVGKKEKNILACRLNYKLFVYLPRLPCLFYWLYEYRGVERTPQGDNMSC